MSGNTLAKKNRFTMFCTQAAVVVTGVLFALLTFASFIQTYTFDNGAAGEEGLTAQNDNIFINIAFIIIFLTLGLFCIRKHVKIYKINPLISVLVMIVVTTALTGFWNILTQLEPVSDSNIVANAAREAAQGNYTQFLDGPNIYAWDPNYYDNHSYFAFYPFQLGYVFICEMIIRVFGTGVAFFTLKVANILAIDFSYLALILIINRLTKNRTIVNLSAIALTLSFQTVFYSVFTYGNLIGLAFSLWSVYLTILYIQDRKISKIIIATVLIVFAVIAKYNNMIFAIAIAVALILDTINKKQFLALIMAALMLVLPFFSQKLIIKTYEMRAGTEYTTETKQIEYAALGLNEGFNPGWYNETALDLLKNSMMNQELADSNARRIVNERMGYFISNPLEGFRFFITKILTQYCEPTYGSIWLCQTRSSAMNRDETKFESSIYTGGLNEVLIFCFDIYTMFVYLGYTLYLLRLFLRKDTDPTNSIIPVCTLGGLIYHTIFEAKSQYIFPYYILMIPFAAAGLYYALKAANKRLNFLFTNRNLSPDK